VLESVLSYNASQSNGPFIGGKEPGHVDACVWGWYAFSRVNRQGTREIWENKELPRVGEWVTAIFDAGLAKEKDLFEAS
jgi:glutathione S-transferase